MSGGYGAPGTFWNFHAEGPVEAYKSFKLGMWIFLATEVVMFGGLFAALFYFKFRYPEIFLLGSQSLDWQLGALNTAILLASSFTMALAVDSAQRGKQKRLVLNLVLTLIFAAGFLVVKYIEWGGKFKYDLYPGSDLFFSIYYMTTGLHLIHVLIGMAVIGGVILRRALKGVYHEENFGGVEMGGLYWHLVDIVWIYLFPLLYLLRH